MIDYPIELYSTRVTLDVYDDGSQFVETRIVDRDGDLIATWSDDLPLPVIEPPTSMQFGIVCPAANGTVGGKSTFGYAAHITAVGPERCQMLGQYNEPGRQVKAWAGAGWPDPTPSLPTYAVCIRMKDRPDPAWAQPWADSIPAHIREVHWCHQHEIKPGESYADGTAITPARYKEAYAIMDQIRANSLNAAKIKLTPIAMEYQLSAGMRFEDWWPVEADFFGNDIYSNEQAFAGYRPIEDLAANTIKYARMFNRPAAIMEWGGQIDRPPGQTDAERAKWITHSIEYFRAQKLNGGALFAWVNWWSSVSTNKDQQGVNNDFVLLRPGSSASLAAYKSA